MDESGLRWESFVKDEKRVRKESLGKDFEKKLCVNREISILKCRDDIALYSAQTKTFFAEERGLTIGGLNLKFAADVAFITDADVEGLFGKCTKLPTTNTFLKPEARKDLLELYSKIYGSSSVTNNKFAGWLVKGYIANLKKRSVNWALAASTIALEKAERAQRLLFRFLNPESIEDATTSSFKHSTCTFQGVGIGSRSIGAMVKTEGIAVRRASFPSGLGFGSFCPYGVFSADLDLVQGVRELEGEVLVIATSKAKFLEIEYKRISDKLVGYKFTMDDCRSTAKEDEEKVVQFQAEFERASKAVLEYELQGIGISIGSAEHNEFAKQLILLQTNRDLVEKKVEVARSMAESSREREIKGEDLYQDIEDEEMRAKSDLQILRREIVDMNRFNTAVQEQCVQMDQRGGLSIWPKLALHPAMIQDTPPMIGSLQLHPCIFCNRDYPYFDIVVASCRHIYHIFCASALAKVDNRCSQCREIFHPHWWQSFGFQCAYSQFEDETNRLQLHAELEEFKQSLKENGSRHVMNCRGGLLEALTTAEVVGHCLGHGGLLNNSILLYNQLLMSRKKCFSSRAFLLLCFFFISCGVKHARSQSSLKHYDRGSCESIPVSFGPVNGRPRATTTRVCTLPSLANFTSSVEPHTTDIGFEISNSLGQEVDSPIRNRGLQVRETVDEDGTATPENSTLTSASELPNSPKLKSTMLKRAADLPFDDGDGRKKIALNSLGEKNAHVGLNIESDTEERPQSRAQNLASEKDKEKGKHPKRKPRDPPPSASGRVSTRAEAKRR